ILAAAGATDSQTYGVNGESAPSIESVVGFREMNADLSLGADANGAYMTVSYRSGSVMADLQEYINILVDNGWAATRLEGTEYGGAIQMTTEASQPGTLKTIDVEYAADTYAIRMQVIDGTLTRFTDEADNKLGEIRRADAVTDVPAVSVTGAERDDILGVWRLTSVLVDGVAFNPMGMDVTLEFRADYTARQYDSLAGETTGTWALEYGSAVFTAADGSQTAYELVDGDLRGELRGAVGVFERESAQAAPVATVSADPDGLLGDWYLTAAEANGVPMDLVDIVGPGDVIMVLGEGNAALMRAPNGNDTAGTWYYADGKVFVTPDGAGTVDYILAGDSLLAEEDGFKLIFQKKQAQAAPVAAAVERDDFLGVWYVIAIEINGVTMDAAEVGMEMSMDLRMDNSAHLYSSMNGNSVGSWAKKDGQVILTTENGDSNVLLFAGDTVSIVQDEGAMTFGREKPAAVATESPIRTVSLLSDFDGVWNAVNMRTEGMLVPVEAMGFAVSMRIENGAAVISLGDQSAIMQGAFHEGVLELVGEDGVAFRAAFHEDGTVSVVFDDSTTLYFQKESGNYATQAQNAGPAIPGTTPVESIVDIDMPDVPWPDQWPDVLPRMEGRVDLTFGGLDTEYGLIVILFAEGKDAVDAYIRQVTSAGFEKGMEFTDKESYYCELSGKGYEVVVMYEFEDGTCMMMVSR
ncbi:MAG: hypothetical protein FWG37_05825, partial [Clostridia bacterium]|nr:hypothetical protein [Clostridia bacterium]